ncbi:MAG: Hcp family type VI secretion system effector [Fimbriimonas sp.]
MPIYMSLSGLPGESTHEQYPQWIEIESFSWGVNNSATGRAWDTMNVSGNISFPAPKLMLACAAGTHIKQGIIACSRSSSDKPLEYLRITLQDVMVSSFHEGDSSGEGGPPSIMMSLNFTKITYKATTQRPDGSLISQTAWWDLKSNTGG